MKSLIIPFSIVLCLAAPKKNTPITESTYETIEASCNHCCQVAFSNSNSDKYVAYCSCACSEIVANVRFVVDDKELRYENELIPYFRELLPTNEQVNQCKERTR